MGKRVSPVSEKERLRFQFKIELVHLFIEWANLESLFVGILARLLKSNSYRAEIVFYSVGSASARRDLIWRLFAVFVKGQKAREEFGGYLVRFKRLTATRNKYAHAIYTLRGCDTPSEITSLRFSNDFDGEPYVSVEPVTKAMLNEIRVATDACASLNTDVYEFTKRLGRLVREKPVEPLHTHDEQAREREPSSSQ